MLSLTSVSASEDVIGDVADEFMLPCQRVHAMTVTVYVAAGIRTGVTGSQASRLDHSATTLRRRCDYSFFGVHVCIIHIIALKKVWKL